jgi:hypothetical protein
MYLDAGHRSSAWRPSGLVDFSLSTPQRTAASRRLHRASLKLVHKRLDLGGQRRHAILRKRNRLRGELRHAGEHLLSHRSVIKSQNPVDLFFTFETGSACKGATHSMDKLRIAIDRKHLILRSPKLLVDCSPCLRPGSIRLLWRGSPYHLDKVLGRNLLRKGLLDVGGC